MERHFLRRIDELESIFAFVREFQQKARVEDKKVRVIDFTLEELFTNMVKHNSKGESDIRIALSKEADTVVMRLTDFDSDRFDITEVPPPDVDAPIEERRPGGLGLHLVKQLNSKVEYCYEGRESQITVTM